MVASNVRFALGAVEDYRIAILALANGQLDVGGEGCAAHAAYARRLYGGNYERGIDRFNVAKRVEVGPFVRKVVFDGHDSRGTAQQQHLGADSGNLAGYARVYRKAYEAVRIRDLLTYLYVIAYLYAGRRGGAYAHGHRDIHAIRYVFAYGQAACGGLAFVLVVQWMHATLEGMIWQSQHLPFMIFNSFNTAKMPRSAFFCNFCKKISSAPLFLEMMNHFQR